MKKQKKYLVAYEYAGEADEFKVIITDEWLQDYKDGFNLTYKNEDGTIGVMSQQAIVYVEEI